ncbi:MAG TPA: cysteine--tRNA ligase [Candidatus Paceibacterota bacterium]|nr:cysteine--tRNA ligase [Candidatus Paceibacterota bacterium]
MALKVYNTLGRKLQEFKSLKEGRVSMYSCGPTVYNYAHIGNLRTYIFNDILKRSLQFLGYKVVHVMNVTDVDDKTIKGSVKEGLSLKEFTQKYEDIFFKELDELNIIKPTHILRATESISDMVKIIKTLEKKGYAYKTSDGIYFAIDKFRNYGKLAQLEKTIDKNKKQRINSDEYDKENAQDFALWKFYIPEDGNVFWETDIGKGRPGWHIECSAMSMKIIGSTLDIHTGASDLIFPHHTNEIAQSEAATGKKFVNYWIHGGFLTMKEGKMSKSLGNVFYLEDLQKKGFKPLDYRYMCLTTHYRAQLLFTLENLEAAKNSYQRLKNICENLKSDNKKNESYIKEFKKAVEDDLDMPNALQVLWKLLRDEKAVGKYQTVKKMDEVFGLKLFEKDVSVVPGDVIELVEERENARKNKDWKKSDDIRDKLKLKGYEVSDTKDGPVVKKIN